MLISKFFGECEIPLKKGCYGYGAAQGIEAEIPQARPRRAEELERIARSCRAGARQDAPKFKTQSCSFKGGPKDKAARGRRRQGGAN
jgi:hypothetical protein